MSPEENNEIIRDLFAKHGDVPLINLVRRLVVALDQTEPGTEHRNQTLELLKLLTQQDNIPSQSSKWLDWLETDGNSITWESLRSSKFSEKTPQEKSRKTVEVPNEPVSAKDRPRPMTREQQIWDKALKRNENRHKGFSKLLRVAIFTLIIVSLTYLGYQQRHIFTKAIETFKSRNLPVVIEKMMPEFFWSALQPTRNPMDDQALLSYLQQEGGLQRLGIESWGNEPLTNSKKILLRLFIQEQTYAWNASAPTSPSSLELRSFPIGQQQWDIERTGPDGTQQTFHQSQTILFEQNRIDMSIKRASGTNGIAHRIILGQQGLLAWSWRLRIGEDVIDGQMVRQTNPERMSIQITMPKKYKISTSYNIDPKLVLLPAVWTPALMVYQQYPVVHPISGLICSKSVFDGSLSLKQSPKGLRLMDANNNWHELWNEHQGP